MILKNVGHVDHSHAGTRRGGGGSTRPGSRRRDCAGRWAAGALAACGQALTGDRRHQEQDRQRASHECGTHWEESHVSTPCCLLVILTTAWTDAVFGLPQRGVLT